MDGHLAGARVRARAHAQEELEVGLVAVGHGHVEVRAALGVRGRPDRRRHARDLAQALRVPHRLHVRAREGRRADDARKPTASIATGRTPPGAAMPGAWTKRSRPRAAGSAGAACEGRRTARAARARRARASRGRRRAARGLGMAAVDRRGAKGFPAGEHETEVARALHLPSRVPT